jgi:hypothetical protein
MSKTDFFVSEQNGNVAITPCTAKAVTWLNESGLLDGDEVHLQETVLLHPECDLGVIKLCLECDGLRIS